MNRGRKEYLEFLKQEEEERMKPVLEAVAAHNATMVELHGTLQQFLTSQPDPRLEADAVPEWVQKLHINYSMETVREGLGDTILDGAYEDAVREFRQQVPEFIPTEHNQEMIIGYLNANQLDPCDSRSLVLAFDMLNGCYLLDTAESLAAEEAHRNPPPKEYTPEEIEKMSADEYRKAILEPQFANAPPPPEPKQTTQEELEDDALTAEEFKEKYKISWARSWGRD